LTGCGPVSFSRRTPCSWLLKPAIRNKWYNGFDLCLVLIAVLEWALTLPYFSFWFLSPFIFVVYSSSIRFGGNLDASSHRLVLWLLLIDIMFSRRSM
jgi:hypothetical protein